MTTCTRCHRPLKWPTSSGMGPVCTKAYEAARECEPTPQLWLGLDAAVEQAQIRLARFIEQAALEARREVYLSFKVARAAAKQRGDA